MSIFPPEIPALNLNLLPPPAPQAQNEVPDEASHFNYPGSDIVLRSRDSYNFPLPKLYIVICSPVLRNLIESVSSDIPNGDEHLPVVNIPESKETLYSLLTFIFPVTPVLPPTTEKTMELLAVAQKYEMKSVVAHVRAICRQDPPFLRSETAFHVYFLAQQHGLRHEAVQAARLTLHFPMTIEGLGDKLDFAGMTGVYLHELWKYHEQVRNELKSAVLGFRNSGLPDDVQGLTCARPSSRDNPSFPQWLYDYIKSIAETPHLFDLTEFETAWGRHVQSYASSFYGACACATMPSQVKRSFWKALTAVVHRTLEKVRRTCVTTLHRDSQCKYPQEDSTLTLVKEEPTSEYLDLPSAPLRLDVPDADIIVRSSDRFNFRVHKSVLAMSSPFFKDLLSLPQPPDGETVVGLPVVALPEDAGLLKSLISLLYPISPVIPDSYQKVFALLAVCQKYEMESVQSVIRSAIYHGKFPAPVQAESFRAYAIASGLGLVPEAEDAARLTLGQPMTFESLGEGLRLFKGQALCDLIRYRGQNTQSHQPVW
jgi:hypothetical protein